MHLFHRRPLALACFLFLVGLGGGYWILQDRTLLRWIAALALFLAALALLLVAFPQIRCRRGRGIVSVALALSLLSVGLFYSSEYFCKPYERASALCGEGTFTFTVREITYASDYGTYGLGELITAEGDSLGIRFSVESEVSLGDRVTGEGVASLFAETSYDFEERQYYLARGAFLDVELEEVFEIAQTEEGRVSRMLSRLNRRVRAVLEVNLGRSSFGLVSGMLLGNREDVPASVRRDFSELGISHLLALSGLHLAVVCGFLERLTVGIPRRMRCVLLIFAAVGYAALTGFSASVVRAAVMLCAVYLSFLAGYRRDPITILALIAVGMCLVSPYRIMDVSFQLSFLAAVACVTVARKGRESKRRGGRFLGAVLDTARTGLFISLMTMPILGLFSARASLLTPIANLIFIPLSALLLTLSPLFLLLRSVPVLSRLLALGMEGLSLLILRASEIWAAHSFGTFSVDGVARELLLGLLAVGIFLLLVLGSRTRRICTVLCIALFFSVFAAAGIEDYVLRDHTVITEVSYKKNDVLTLRHKGDNYLIDVSDGSATAVSKGYRSLIEEGERRVDGWILTHYHQRHLRSLRHLAEDMYLSVLYLPAPESEADASIYRALCEEAKALGVEVRTYSRAAGTRLVLDGCEIELMEYELLSRTTHPSIAFAIRKGEDCFGYLGLSVGEGDTSFDEDLMGSADLLLFGSHGPVQKESWSLTGEAYACATVVSAPYLSEAIDCMVYEKLVVVLP